MHGQISFEQGLYGLLGYAAAQQPFVAAFLHRAHRPPVVLFTGAENQVRDYIRLAREGVQAAPLYRRRVVNQVTKSIHKNKPAVWILLLDSGGGNRGFRLRTVFFIVILADPFAV